MTEFNNDILTFDTPKTASKSSVYNLNSYMMKAFLSTPRFVEDLTRICELVLQAPDDKLRFLKQ